jgi:hypothetical protein
MEYKTCSRCGLKKTVTEFHISKTNKSGFASACKKCIAVSVDHEKKLINDRKYKDSHREELKVKARIKNKTNPEEKHNRYIRYYCKNKELVKNKSKKWYKENKDRANEYTKNYNIQNKEKVSVSKRNLVLLKAYGMTEKDYEDLYNSQNGVCAICGKPETSIHNKTNKPRRLAVDHDHATGKVRGLLCGSCNTAMGKFCDSVQVLQKVIMYLEKYK